MTFPGLRLAFPSGLRARFLIFTFGVMVAVAVPASVAFLWIVDTTVVKLGTLFAEKQILFDRYRGLESLMREVSLAETLARAPAILDWAADEASPEKEARGLAELEHYRLSFKDRSYFAVIHGSGNYYFNDSADSFAGRQHRYVLSPDKPRDGWYYRTVALGAGCHLNVDHDDNLSVTKVWINCIIRRGATILGVIGTGVDLSQFIREVVDIPQTGVQSIFVDRSGAVQAHRDPRLVDFHSLTKDIRAKKTIFRLLDTETDRTRIAEMMAEVAGHDVLVRSSFMTIGGRQFLVGVGYLDRLGWFNVTLMDVDLIIERRLFMPIALLLAAILAAAAGLMSLLFKNRVLDRLARLETSMQQVEGGDFVVPALDRGNDEIGRLSRVFGAMAKSVGSNTHVLEAMVRERTEKLERLAYFDALTGICNRRGFIEAYGQEQNRALRGAKQLGLLLIDLDRFKEINDGFGHQAGDRIIIEVARRISATLRNYDVSARWGGDEFIVLIADCNQASLSGIATKMLAAISGDQVPLGDAGPVDITISIGACLPAGAESLDAAVARADGALYAAKRAGRNRFVMLNAAGHGATELAPSVLG